MKLTVKTVLLGLSLTIMPLAAQAATDISIDFGAIAFGYTDGYWDHDHHWHRWPNHASWQRYQNEHHDHAFNYKHTHDHDHGWHDHDRYWEHG